MTGTYNGIRKFSLYNFRNNILLNSILTFLKSTLNKTLSRLQSVWVPISHSYTNLTKMKYTLEINTNKKSSVGKSDLKPCMISISKSGFRCIGSLSVKI